jgi:hypothetical protein
LFLSTAPGSPKPFGQVVDETLEYLDERLGSIPLPGGRTVPVKNVLGWALATAAVIIGFERRHDRRSRELTPL